MPRTLRLDHPNQRGDDVMLLQRRLVELGHEELGEPDGLFGPGTDEAVRAFQQARGLSIDGVVGSGTWSALAQASVAEDRDEEPGADSGIRITKAHLRAAAPNARDDQLEALVEPLGQAMARWGIDSRLRCAHFLAQIAHESANFRARRENLNYSADALGRVFGKYFREPGLAQQYHRQPEKIANRVYADRMENGPEESGDGWRYRGRGLIQLTGKRNYRAYSEAVGEDFLANPGPIADDLVRCADVAGWYWDSAGCNEPADADDVERVTKKINGGTHGLDDRRVRLAALKRAFGIA